MQEITPREEYPSIKELEKKVKEITEELGFTKKMLDTVPALIYIRDCRDQGIKWCNKTTEETFGFTREKIILLGKRFWKLIAHPDDLYLAEQSSKYYAENRPNFGGVVRLKTTYTEEWRWFVGISTIFKKDRQDKPLETLVIFLDFTAALNTYSQIGEALRQVLNQQHKKLIEELTKREKEIISLLIKGYNNNRIAQKLNVSRYTVETHRKNIRLKLSVKNTSELLAIGQKIGL